MNYDIIFSATECIYDTYDFHYNHLKLMNFSCLVVSWSRQSFTLISRVEGKIDIIKMSILCTYSSFFTQQEKSSFKWVTWCEVVQLGWLIRYSGAVDEVKYRIPVSMYRYDSNQVVEFQRGFIDKQVARVTLSFPDATGVGNWLISANCV